MRAFEIHLYCVWTSKTPPGRFTVQSINELLNESHPHRFIVEGLYRIGEFRFRTENEATAFDISDFVTVFPLKFT